jgi:phosphoribosyl 1,2-cyclic phosphate phosphodiesterase
VCTSADPHDKRLRTSAVLRAGGRTVSIDAGPDFRQQMLRASISRLDAVVFTHEHKDHVAGLDDVRAYNFIQKADMPVFATHRVEQALRREFHYIFSQDPYPGIPRITLHRVTKAPFEVGDARWWPLPVTHAHLPVMGYRVGGLAYITDANHLESLAWERLKGVDTLILNALRREFHVSHFTLDEALQVIERVKPRVAYLTHFSHQMGLTAKVAAELPDGVHPAVDGLTIGCDGPEYVPSP